MRVLYYDSVEDETKEIDAKAKHEEETYTEFAVKKDDGLHVLIVPNGDIIEVEE